MTNIYLVQLLPNKLVTPLLLFCLSLLWPWWCPSSSGGHRAVRCNQDLVEVKGWGWHVVKGITSFGAVAFCVSSCLFILFACSAMNPFILTWTEMSLWRCITGVRLFLGYLWPNQWSHQVLIGVKWKIWIRSFQRYPLGYCRSSGLATRAS